MALRLPEKYVQSVTHEIFMDDIIDNLFLNLLFEGNPVTEICSVSHLF